MAYASRRLRLERKQRQKFFSRWALRVLISLFVLFLLGRVMGQAKELMLQSLAKTVVVSFGELENKITVQAIIARHEMVYRAPVNGRLKLHVQEDQRVPKGFTLAEVMGEGSNQEEGQPVYRLVAEKAGIVCYHLDGLEQVVTPLTILGLDDRALRQKLEEAGSSLTESGEGKPLNLVDSGTVLLKVIDNLKPIVLDFRVSREALAKMPEIGEEIYFRLPGEKDRWPATLIQVAENQGELRLVAESTRYSPQLLHRRAVELELITGIYKGYIVPRSAVMNRGEEAGVYVSSLGQFRIKPVELEGQVGEMAVVSGLEPGDEVLVNPQIIMKE